MNNNYIPSLNYLILILIELIEFNNEFKEIVLSLIKNWNELILNLDSKNLIFKPKIIETNEFFENDLEVYKFIIKSNDTLDFYITCINSINVIKKELEPVELINSPRKIIRRKSKPIKFNNEMLDDITEITEID